MDEIYRVATVQPSQGYGEHPEIYQEFGLLGHNGIDYPLAEGTPVPAVESGTLVKGYSEGYGLYAYVLGARRDWLYAHLSQVAPEGQVYPGQTVGLSGNTGFTFGPNGGYHLHLGCRPKPYNTASGYRGYVDFSHMIVRRVRNKLVPHCQRTDYPDWLTNSMERLRNRCEHICVMNPPNDRDPFPYQQIIARHWWGSNSREHDFVWQGELGGKAYFEAMKPVYDRARYVAYWRGPNEPAVITPEERELFVGFYRGLLPRAHDYGIKIAGPELSVGHPGGWAGPNNPDWEECVRSDVRDMRYIYENVDLITSHYYGRRAGNQWTSWDDWTLRFQIIMDELDRLGVPEKPWVSTEGGLDQYGVPDASGWKGPGHGDYNLYADQLWELNNRLQWWPRMRSYALFGFTPEADWRQTFEHDERLWVGLLEPCIMALDEIPSVPDEDGVVKDLVWQACRKTEIPIHESFALEREAASRWPECFPKSDEAEVLHRGVTWVGRKFYDPSDRKTKALWTVKGDWNPQHFEEYVTD